MPLNHPVLAQSIAHIDLGHALDKRFEIGLAETGADATQPARDILPRHVERDRAFHLTPSHDHLFRIVRALSGDGRQFTDSV
jgi:hypothetical protein